MRRTLTLTAALLVAFACGEAGDGGPVAFGIVAGDGQVVEAGRDSLSAPVIGQAYRDASGAITFGLVSDLHAQTPIGTGVANVLTCAEPVGETGLKPYIACDETDAQGFATYWFDPSTKAGEHCAEIRAEVDGQPAKLATTCSEVKPGPAYAGLGWRGPGGGGTGGGVVGDTLHGSTLTGPADQFGNPLPWRFEVLSGPAHVPSADMADDLSRALVPDAMEASGTVRVITPADTSADGTWESFLNPSNGKREIEVHFDAP